MTNDAKVFGNQDQGSQQEGGQDAQSQSTDMQMIGEGKQYSDMAAADKALVNGKEHITTLEQENAKMREIINGNASVQEILDQAKAQALLQGNAAADQQTESHQSLNQEDLIKLVDQTLTQRTQESIEQENAGKVFDIMSAKYGDKAQEVYDRVAKEMNVDMDKISRRSPTAALKLLIGDHQAPSTDMYQQESVNSQAVLSNRATEVEKIKTLQREGKLTREQSFQKQWELEDPFFQKK